MTSAFAFALEALLNKQEEEDKKDTALTVSMFQWKKWAAIAAAIILLFTIGGYFLHVSRSTAPTVAITHPILQDVPPGRNKAILTLADGSHIVLDNAAKGSLAQQGYTKIIKLDSGRLAYNTSPDPTMSGPTQPAAAYNTLTTPRGGQYQLELPDGTRVWLNAESSITYPVSFTGKDRSVRISGEVYFEVARDKNKPFHVKVPVRGDIPGKPNDMDITVTGTHFNVNAYPDELLVRTTLLEGGIKVSKGNKTSLVKPGEQTRLNAAGEMNVIGDVDVEEAVAWKNGLFQFNHADLELVMRQLSRWYDVEIVYEKNIPKMDFGGKMQRDLHLADILEILEKTDVHFKIVGKKIIVMP